MIIYGWLKVLQYHLHSIMLFIIWFSFLLLLLVPNWDTIFFLWSSDHFWVFVSAYCYFIAVERMSNIEAGCQSMILPFSTTATRYSPGSLTPSCEERINYSFVFLTSYFLPYLTPFIWLNWRILILLPFFCA